MTKFKIQYEAFIKIHGDPFDKKVVPMDDTDLTQVRKSARFNRRVSFPFFPLIGCGTLTMLIYAIYIQELKYIIGFGLCTIAVFSLSIYLWGAGQELLNEGVKTVITGIVVDKKKHGSWGYEKYFGLYISDRETIFGSLNEFMDFKSGDIVRYELIGYERNKEKKIERLGNIAGK